MNLRFNLSRKGMFWLGGVPSLGAVLYFVAGVMLRIAPDAPPEFIPENHDVAVPQSSIFVPVDLEARALASLVETALQQKQLVKGTSTKLIAEAVFGLIDLPPEARQCNPVQVVKRVVEEVKCKKLGTDLLGDLGRVGECFWNNTGGRVMKVARDVVVNTVECTGLDKLVQELSPVPELGYSVRLKSLSMRGNPNGSFEIRTKSTAELRLQSQGRVLRDIDWIDTQKCAVPVRVNARATINVAVRGDQLFINPDISKMDFDLDKGACKLGFAKHVDLDGLGELFRSEIGRALTPALENALIGAVDGATDEPVATKQIKEALKLARGMLAAPVALPVNPPVWVKLNADEMLVSPKVRAPKGAAETVRVAGGFTSAPQLLLAEPARGRTDVPVRVEEGEYGGFHLVPTAHIPLELIEQKANEAVRAFLEEKAPWLGFGELKVHAYQNRQRLVLGVSLRSVSIFRASVEVYVTAQPVFDSATNEVVLEDIKLDVESSEALIARVGWYVEGALEAALAPFMRFEVDPQFDQVIKALADFRVKTKDGAAELHIALDDLRLETFWLDDNTLNAAVAAHGRAQIAADLSKLP